MSALTFANPAYLYALLVVLPAAAALWYAGFWLRRKARAAYGEEKLVDRYTRKISFASELVQLTAWLVSLTLLAVAAAGPLLPDAPEKARKGSLQVVVVMDVSKSMAAEDYRSSMPGADGTDGALVLGPHGSRLDMTKHVIVTKIMPAIPGNQIGVVTYTGSGFPQADLTDDFVALRFVLTNWVKVGGAPGGGSDFAEGLKEALATFKRDEDPGRDKVIVLFSDGGFTGDRAELSKVTQEIVEKRIRVIIIGLGMPTAIQIPVYEGTKLTGYMQKNGQVVMTALEEGELIALAQATGGEYIHLVNDKDVNIQWASKLAGTKTEERQKHLYVWPLSAALAILIALYLGGLLRRKDLVVPQASSHSQ